MIITIPYKPFIIFLFETLYTWAGDFRTINIYKSEKVLNGLSITYSDHTKIQHDLQYIFNWAKQVTWSHQNPQLPSSLSKLMTDNWRVQGTLALSQFS